MSPRVFAPLLLMLVPTLAAPEVPSLFRSETFAAPGAALLPTAAPVEDAPASASLFIGIDPNRAGG